VCGGPPPSLLSPPQERFALSPHSLATSWCPAHPTTSPVQRDAAALPAARLVPRVHTAFPNLEAGLMGTHYGVARRHLAQHLQGAVPWKVNRIGGVLPMLTGSTIASTVWALDAFVPLAWGNDRVVL